MSGNRSLPPVWNKVGRHDVFPEARHDEIARFNFLTNMNMHLSSVVIPGVREAYEQRAEPEFRKQKGRSPESRQEVRELMSRDSYYQWWSALRRSTMEMRQQAGRSMVLRQIDSINEKAAKLNDSAETLKLDSSVKVPTYASAVDIHCMPGCYHTALSDGDVSAGANYDCGLFVTTAGLLGTYTDGGGKAIAEWLQKDQPNFKPRRILDIGCTVGHNVLPIAQAFPDAEVIAIDTGEPVLRYGHARAKSLGVNNVTFMQANAENLAQFEDGSFDLITTSMFLHETSFKSMPRILAEISRLLSPGGLSLHLEQPQYTGRPVFEQFMRDWDTFNNNEPFWGTMHDQDLTAMIDATGLPAAEQFQAGIAASVDETIFPKVDTQSKTEDFGRAPVWNVFGAWKPVKEECVA
ncbi:class I SAM-dependent methyltransferase [Halioxenophilus sp. WMMB6]|uniref:class I SAM-dependent methyltransferase n=1 Tax=Halioxenophilus sp. WMMB6 TaxID=3073815 RepID=UPI00295E8A53|nr:class I SAM-dependent methyltransferase [Halioxenophilus sp. WMMB6]